MNATIQRDIQMLISFKEFLKINNANDNEIRDALVSLSSKHSIFKNNIIIRSVLSDPDKNITYSDLVDIHKDVSSYIMKIAPKSLKTATEHNVLALSEMIALQSSLSLLNALIVTKSQSAIEKIASLNATTRLATENT